MRCQPMRQVARQTVLARPRRTRHIGSGSVSTISCDRHLPSRPLRKCWRTPRRLGSPWHRRAPSPSSGGYPHSRLGVAPPPRCALSCTIWMAECRVCTWAARASPSPQSNADWAPFPRRWPSRPLLRKAGCRLRLRPPLCRQVRLQERVGKSECHRGASTSHPMVCLRAGWPMGAPCSYSRWWRPRRTIRAPSVTAPVVARASAARPPRVVRVRRPSATCDATA